MDTNHVNRNEYKNDCLPSSNTVRLSVVRNLDHGCDAFGRRPGTLLREVWTTEREGPDVGVDDLTHMGWAE